MSYSTVKINTDGFIYTRFKASVWQTAPIDSVKEYSSADAIPV